MYKTALIYHRNMHRIAIIFPYDKEKTQHIRKIPGARWSSTRKCWHIPDTKVNRIKFRISVYANTHLTEITVQKIEEFVQWLKSKRYSESTIKVYVEVVRVFFIYFKNKIIEEITNDDVIEFNNAYILKKKLSASYQNQFVNGLKLFYRVLGSRNIDVQLILRPRTEHRLPNVLSKEEVKSILQVPTNLKHRTMLSLIYACGLRRSELLQLKPKDILSERHLLHIFQSKGKKDRIVPISDKVIAMLRDYFKAYKPEVWLFEGQKRGTLYSPRSLQLVLKQALAKTKIKKDVTLHWLRHSYATHLLENGTDIRYIQELLGHNSSRTTEIYTHVSSRDIQKIRSPFDEL